MARWAFECDEVSLLFPFKLPSFHTLSREKKTRSTPIFKSKQLRIKISCSQQETMLSQQTQRQMLCLEMGEGKRKEGKSKEGTSFLLFGCTIEEKSEWVGVMIFPWSPWYQPNLGGNGKCIYPNILYTYIPKTKTIQPNYPNLHYI